MEKRRTLKVAMVFLILQIWMLAWMENPLVIKAADETVIRVGYPHMRGTSETYVDGIYSGYTYEYLEKISQITDWNYEFVTPEGNENEQLITLMEMLANGEIDLLGSALKSEEIEKQYDFPNHSYGVTYSTLSIAETNTELNEVTISMAESLTIGVRKTAKKRIQELERYCDLNDIALTLTECDTNEELLVHLFAEEVDAILGVDLTPYEGTRVVAKLAGDNYYFMTTKGNTEIIKELDNALATISQTNPYFQMNLYNECITNRRTDLILTKEEKEYIDEIDTIKVLVPTESAPFQHQTQSGFSGISIECLNRIAEDMNMNIEYIMRDSAMDISESIEQNEIDIVIGIPNEREFAVTHNLFLSQSYTQTETSIFSRRTFDMADTENNILALPAGAGVEPDMTADEIIYYRSIEECLLAIENGEADFGYGNSHSVSYYMTKNIYSNLVTAQLPNRRKEFCFGFTKPLDTTLIAIINRAISTFDNSQMQSFLVYEILELDHEVTLKQYIAMNPEKFIFVIGLSSMLIIFAFFYTIKLKQKEQLLLEQNKAKERFLSDMSHEMRTPLSAIIGLNELLLKEIENNDQKECALKIRDSSKHLLGLINDILDLSKIGQGKLSLKEKEFDLNKTLVDIDVIYRITAQSKNLIFETCFPKDIEFMLIGDELRLKQVIINLLSNAIKYNKVNGMVCFHVALSEETQTNVSLSFSIKDTGYGIKKNNRKKIFEAFEREARVEGESGTGLGLSISRNIAQLMEGSLTFESQEGIGSNFIFKVKLKKSKLKEELSLQEEKEAIPDLTGYSVLLVEDNEINAMICKKLLLECNAVVDIAQNGEIACEKFADSGLYYYKVILMDIRMPIMNGLEASERIRSLQRLDAENVVIIALSANAFEADRKKSWAAGMNAHLAKPIKQKELYDTLEKQLSKQTFPTE